MPKTAQKDASVATVKKQGAVMKHIKKYWQWYAMMFIPIVYYIVFRYIPMFGNIIAFRRYRTAKACPSDRPPTIRSTCVKSWATPAATSCIPATPSC